MGHMKAIQQGIRSTSKNNQSSSTKQNNDVSENKNNTSNQSSSNQTNIDNDDDDLLPPCSQLEREKGHHIVCYVVNLQQLKGIISTDLPGRFPFPLDLLNNYIFVLYDYDSNAILIQPIKSRDKSKLIRGFQLCYNELQKSNIKPIIH